MRFGEIIAKTRKALKGWLGTGRKSGLEGPAVRTDGIESQEVNIQVTLPGSAEGVVDQLRMAVLNDVWCVAAKGVRLEVDEVSNGHWVVHVRCFCIGRHGAGALLSKLKALEGVIEAEQVPET